jgi:hypothetical protein
VPAPPKHSKQSACCKRDSSMSGWPAGCRAITKHTCCTVTHISEDQRTALPPAAVLTHACIQMNNSPLDMNNH